MDLLGAEMVSSRWRVSLAFYCQVLAFTLGPYFLGSLLSLGYVLALTTAFVWWLGVHRDHQKDDLKYLQSHLSMVAQQLKQLEACVQDVARVEQEQEQQREQQQEQQQEVAQSVHAARDQCRTIKNELQRVNNQLQFLHTDRGDREMRLCKRWNVLLVEV